MSKDLGSDTVAFKGISYSTTLGAAVAAAAGAPAMAQDNQSERRDLEEIVVTATKRAEGINDIPMSIQAFTTEDITRQNLFSLEDYTRFVPSMSYFGNNSGGGKVFFRGVADAPDTFIADSSAAVYLDEQPLTSSAQVDVRLVDVERVEALSGPQGTLFGSSAQSGTLRIVTNKPDPTAFSAFADAMVKGGSEGDSSYDFSAMLNLPLVEDKFAVRLVGFSAVEGGYIDNVLGITPICEAGLRCHPDGPQDNADVVEDDWNETSITGGRLAAKWFVNDDWNMTTGIAYQKSESDAENTYDPTVGDLQVVAFHPDTRDDEWTQFSLTFEGDLGWADFVSATAYFTRDSSYVQDTTSYSAYFGTFCYDVTYDYITYYAGTPDEFTNYDVRFQTLTSNIYCFQPEGFGVYYGDPVGFLENVQENTSFSQEFRLSGQGERFSWVAGVFYEERTEDWDFWTEAEGYGQSQGYDNWVRPEDQNPAGDFGLDPGVVYGGWNVAPTTGSDVWWYSADRTDWETTAVFADLTYDLSEKFTVSVGARWFDVEMKKDYWVELPEGRRTPALPLLNGLGAPKHGCIAEHQPCNSSDTDNLVDDGFTHPSSVDDDVAVKFALEYNINENIMVYGLYSEGFRPGGTNRNRGQPFFPAQFSGDFLENTEFGFKGTLADGKVQLNMTYYTMDWDDYQLELIDPSNKSCGSEGAPPAPNCSQPWQKVMTNVGQAISDGFEFSMRALPTDGLEIGINASWLNAEVNENVDIIDLVKGDTLPFAPDFKGSLFAQYNWGTNLFGAREAYVQFQYSTIDDSVNQVQTIEIPTEAFQYGQNAPQVVMEGYDISDLKFGLVGDTWEASIFVKNLGDERGQVYHDNTDFEWYWVRASSGLAPNRTSVIRPREYGLRFIKRWGN
jgi:outer membrane receptor protein involved in Fe transport